MPENALNYTGWINPAHEMQCSAFCACSFAQMMKLWRLHPFVQDLGSMKGYFPVSSIVAGMPALQTLTATPS